MSFRRKAKEPQGRRIRRLIEAPGSSISPAELTCGKIPQPRSCRQNAGRSAPYCSCHKGLKQRGCGSTSLKISSPSKTLTASRNSAIYCMAEKLALCVIADATNSAVSGWSLACVRCTGASQDLAPLSAGPFSSYCSLRTAVDGCHPCVGASTYWILLAAPGFELSSSITVSLGMPSATWFARRSAERYNSATLACLVCSTKIAGLPNRRSKSSRVAASRTIGFGEFVAISNKPSNNSGSRCIYF